MTIFSELTVTFDPSWNVRRTGRLEAKVIPANRSIWASVEGTWDTLAISLTADLTASAVVSGSFPELSYMPLRLSVQKEGKKGAVEREREREVRELLKLNSYHSIMRSLHHPREHWIGSQLLTLQTGEAGLCHANCSYQLPSLWLNLNWILLIWSNTVRKYYKW